MIFKNFRLSYKCFCVCVHTCAIRPEQSGGVPQVLPPVWFLTGFHHWPETPIGRAGWPVGPKDSPLCPQYNYYKHILLSFYYMGSGDWTQVFKHFTDGYHPCSPPSEIASCSATHSDLQCHIFLPQPPKWLRVRTILNYKHRLAHVCMSVPR